MKQRLTKNTRSKNTTLKQLTKQISSETTLFQSLISLGFLFLPLICFTVLSSVKFGLSSIQHLYFPSLVQSDPNNRGRRQFRWYKFIARDILACAASAVQKQHTSTDVIGKQVSSLKRSFMEVFKAICRFALRENNTCNRLESFLHTTKLYHQTCSSRVSLRIKVVYS